ncbi:MAG: HAD family phosphatase [Minisyncoccus archaeiphilus]|uniref:HAD family hydrolase n=1 Tax=Minisyncoccus archaeiphilus TaxID=3238481 RepID=UPI0009CAADD4|nr:MAG: Phosphorylated carbohydrates phosphatase [Parcubacteria group bacterium ADurb.Bin216]GMX59745.1 MAG: HAD family phosphatase [Candidatus Parcubacteria bacterium]
MNKSVKGVIFDLDGTLLDTEKYQWKGWLVVMQELGIELLPEDYLLYAGRSGKMIDEELIRRFGLSIKVGSILARKKELLMKWFEEDDMIINPFAEESISYCMDNGYAVSLCSGGDKEEVSLKLERSGLGKYFEVVVCGSDVERNKPFPDIYMRTLSLMGMAPNDCLAVEDTQYGLEAAKEAGLRCFVVPHELSRGQDFSRADKVLDSLEGLIDYLDE